MCPGEAACNLWASTAAKSHAERERKVCHDCAMFPTKTDAGKQNHKYFFNLVNRAFRVHKMRIAGFPPELWQITPMEFETVLIIESAIEVEEIALKSKTSELLTAFFKAKVGAR